MYLKDKSIIYPLATTSNKLPDTQQLCVIDLNEDKQANLRNIVKEALAGLDDNKYRL